MNQQTKTLFICNSQCSRAETLGIWKICSKIQASQFYCFASFSLERYNETTVLGKLFLEMHVSEIWLSCRAVFLAFIRVPFSRSRAAVRQVFFFKSFFSSSQNRYLFILFYWNRDGTDIIHSHNTKYSWISMNGSYINVYVIIICNNNYKIISWYNFTLARHL